MAQALTGSVLKRFILLQEDGIMHPTVTQCAHGSAICTYFGDNIPNDPVRNLGLPCPRAARSLVVYGHFAWSLCASSLLLAKNSDGTPRGWNRTRFRTRILVDFEVPQLQVLELLFLPDHHRTHLHLQVNRGAEVDSDSKISYDLLPTDIFWLCPYSVVAA